MASIRERERGVWEVRVFAGRDAQGRPRQLSRTVRGTKKEAQRVAAALTVTPVNRTAGRTVADALDAWLEANQPTWAPSTVRDNTSRVTLIKADRLSELPLARLDAGAVERWHGRLRAAKVGESSIVNRHRVLRAALAQSQRWGWISTNPAALARLRRAKTATREGMTAGEVVAVLAAAEAMGPDVHLALRLAALSGARRSELAALRWSDVVDGRLTVDSSISTIRAGGAPMFVDGPTKTANRRRVTLDAETLELVDALAAAADRHADWIFAKAGQEPDPDRIGAWWRQARAAAGLSASWRLHDLRHWSATQAIGAGADIRTVAGRLGHANPAMTLRTYAHAIEASDREVAESLSALLARRPPGTP